MRSAAAVVLMLIAACGGPQVPTHNGYKTENAKPWRKPKILKLDDKGEAKFDGGLSYPERRRAQWFALDTSTFGQIEVQMDVTPPGDAVNEDFDVGLEVLDEGFRSRLLADSEAPDAHEFPKKHTLVELPPARYYIHVFLESRLDTCDYTLKLKFNATAPAERKSDFPAQVARLPDLPMVPLSDDAPKNYKPPVQETVVTHVVRQTGKPPPPPPPPPAQLTGRILSVTVQGAGVSITIGRGTSSGASPSMHGKIPGVPGVFAVSCSDKVCVASVAATPDQIKGSGGTVILTP